MKKRFAKVIEDTCVCCGACEKVCPKSAILMYKGCYAEVNRDYCVGCSICTKICPTNSLEIVTEEISNEK